MRRLTHLAAAEFELFITSYKAHPGAMSTSPQMMTDRLRSVRDYWLSLRGVRQMPARKDVDPVDIPHLLPYIVLTEVFHNPLAFKYRLVGTAVTSIFGRDSTGKFIDDALYGSETDRVKGSFVEVANSQAPVAVRDVAQFIGKTWMRIDALFLPISENGETVNMVLCVIDATKATSLEISNRSQIFLDWQT